MTIVKIYKRPYVCFNCRKYFKQPPEEDLIKSKFGLRLNANLITRLIPRTEKYRNYLNNKKYLCPQCRTEMVILNSAIRAPKNSDKKSWKKIKESYQKK